MTDNPNIAAAQEEWWDRSLTSAGRSDILRAARLRLPAKVQWRHMSPEARGAVDHMRPTEFRPENQQHTEDKQHTADLASPSLILTDSHIENALLRGALWLTARRLKDFLDAPRRKVEDDKLQITIPTSLREKATEALEKANSILVLKEGRER